jgi:curved DNA-binding protein
VEYKDYYDILGVSRDADEKEIKRAFRRMARKHHPDVNPGDSEAEDRFKEINEAYEVLSDPEKRQKYDQFGHAYKDWERRGGQSGDFNWGQWGGGAPGGQRVNVQYGSPEDLQDLFGDASPFSDFFTNLFGGMGGGAAPGGAGRPRGGYQRQARPRRGQDLEQEVEISLEEAYHGSTRLLQKDGRRLQVKIPPGAATGTRIRMAGEGGPGAAGGQAGDLYLRVRVADDPRFEREGADLHTTVEVDLYTAVLGGKARVETPSGPVMLTIPEGTQNGQTFRLKGKGMPRLRQPEQHGDLYAEVEAQLPEELTPRQRELFQSLRDLSQEGS